MCERSNFPSGAQPPRDAKIQLIFSGYARSQELDLTL